MLRSHLRMNGRWRVERRAARDGRAARGWCSGQGRTRRCSGTGRCSSSRRRRRGRAAARAGHPRAAARSGTDALAAAARASAAPGRGGAARPAARRRHRQPVEGRGALGGSDLAVARARRRDGRGADDSARGGAPADDRPGSRARAGRLRCTAASGRACRRCGTTIQSRPQGDHARTAYWCPGCQA